LKKENSGADSILVYILEISLRLLHPFMPFITEAIWQKIKDNFQFKKPQSIMTDSYPVASQHWINPAVEATFSKVITLVRGVRFLRAEMHVPPGKKGRSVAVCSEADRKIFAENLDYILELARLEEITFSEKLKERPPKSAVFVADEIEVYLLLGDLIDVEREIARLEKDLAEISERLGRIQTKLKNPGFLSKAAPEVVAAQKAEVELLENKVTATRQNLDSLR